MSEGGAGGDDSRKGRRRPTAKHRLPDGWAPPDAVREWARDKAPAANIDAEAEAFRDHAAANGRTARDWDAAFRSWLRIAQDRAERANKARPTATAPPDRPRNAAIAYHPAARRKV